MQEGTIIALLALMLLASLAGASAAGRLRLPRVVGYLAAGFLLQWSLRGLYAAGMGAAAGLLPGLHFPDAPSWVPQSQAQIKYALMFIKRLALAVVMFNMGLAFETHQLRRLGRGFFGMAFSAGGLSLGLTAGACAAVGLTAGLDEPLLVALMLGILAVSISPDTTLVTVREYAAKGPVTEHVLAITGVLGLVAVLLFDLAELLMVEAGWLVVPGGSTALHMAGLKLLSASAGSIVAGVVCGMVLALLHARARGGQAAVALLATVFAILALEDLIHTDFLLTSLVAGATFINVAPDPGKLEERLIVLGAPLFAMLFVISGFSLRIGVFASATTLLLVGAYVACRVAGMLAGSYLAARTTRGEAEVGRDLGLGLLCQGGLTIGLITSLERLAGPSPPLWVEQFAAVGLGTVALFELSGPLLLKRVLVAGGEVRASRLFHVAPAAPGVWRRLGDQFVSLFERLKIIAPRTPVHGPLLARHVMQSNFKVLRDRARLDEVLHFIERSRLDHFPVVAAEGQYLGVINLADVRELIYQPDLQNLVTAQDLLDAEAPSVGPAETLEEVFEKFRTHRARDLVVIDEATGKPLGIVEQRDVLRAMHIQLMGQAPDSEH